MPGIRCPFCAHLGTDVIDSRPIHEGKYRRRREQCARCGQRWPTVETLETDAIRILMRRRGRLSTGA